MQFRFREYNEEQNEYKVISTINVEDYDAMYKTLCFMKEHKCDYAIELNTEKVVDTIGNGYNVTDVALCISEGYDSEYSLIPHFVVDVEET